MIRNIYIFFINIILINQLRNKFLIIILLGVCSNMIGTNAQYDKWSLKLNESLREKSLEDYLFVLDSIIDNSNLDIEKGVALIFKSKKLIQINKFYDAEILLDKAIIIFTNLNNYKGIGNSYFYKGALSKKQDDTFAISTNYNFAIDNFKMCEYFDGIIVCYLNTGNFFAQRKNFVLAKKQFELAEMQFNSTGNTRIKTSVLLSKAALFADENLYVESVEIYDLIERKYYKDLSLSKKAKFHNNKGAIFIKLDKFNKAQIEFEKSLRFKKRINDTNGVNSTLQNLFNLALKKSDIEKSKIFFDELEKNNKESKLNTNIRVSFLYSKIDYYLLLNKIEKAREAINDLINSKDSVSNAAFSDKLIEMQKSFELKEKDREIALLEKEDALNQARLKTKNILIVITIGFLVVLLIVGYLINRQRKELVQSRRRLLRQKEDITGMNEQLRVSNLSKDRILSVIGHDLRGPVGGLKELIELYMELPEYEPNDIKNLLKAAREASTSTYHLLENLLSWANSQRGELVYNPVSAPVLPLIKQTVQLLDTSINTRHIQFEFDIPESMVVQVDLNMLRTIIRNLVSNALKYSPHESVITISAIEEGQNVRFCVIDQGEGMTAEETERIFKKKETYFIGSEMTAKGTGLGLILCKEFVERHGGTIWIDSEKGRGTNVCFRIPVKSYKTVSVSSIKEVAAQ
ncbi:sensor histidine kinase [Carboxylicivirga sp. RSCT41]|uniref:sensor histidine kinase n=1 Tax=Carboxylicivirga agarovorans TaxID=3417570 RepID=UPI003D33EBD7